MGSFLSKYKFQLLLGLLVVLSLPLAVILSRTSQTGFTPRAAVDKNAHSRIFLSAPATVAPGVPFEIQLKLDPTKDTQFVVAGVDAIINYDEKELLVTQVVDNLGPDGPMSMVSSVIEGNRVKASFAAAAAALTGNNGLPTGPGTEMTLATIKLTPRITSGKFKLSFVYTSPAATDDSNVVGFEKDKPVDRQTPRERLLSEPPVLEVKVAAVASPTPVASSTPAPSSTPVPTPSPSLIPVPTVSPQPEVSLQIELTMLERSQYAISGMVYAVGESLDRPIFFSLPFTTDEGGRARLEVPKKFEGETVQLFVRTPSHLLRQASGPVALVPPSSMRRPCVLGEVCPDVVGPVAVFSNLIPGDVYIAPNRNEQDNVVNAFDALEVIKYLGQAKAKADLNGDGTVNTRDVKIVLDYMGETGDQMPGKKDVSPTSEPRPNDNSISCPAVYDPVCCSGKTYSNSCTAGVAGAKSCQPGACQASQ